MFLKCLENELCLQALMVFDMIVKGKETGETREKRVLFVGNSDRHLQISR